LGLLAAGACFKDEADIVSLIDDSLNHAGAGARKRLEIREDQDNDGRLVRTATPELSVVAMVGPGWQ
jgi:hypothetical protein